MRVAENMFDLQMKEGGEANLKKLIQKFIRGNTFVDLNYIQRVFAA